MKEFNEEIKAYKFTKYPADRRAPQAYNGSDAYLYNNLLENSISEDASVLILNDDTGVLSLLLDSHSPMLSHDSLYAKKSLSYNYLNSGKELDETRFLDGVEFCTYEPESAFGVVIIKVPKSQKLFEDQLKKISNMVNENTLILVSGMVKHVSKNCKESIEKLLGTVSFGPIKKKAMLFTVKWDGKKRNVEDVSEFSIKDVGSFKSYVNTFSKGKLDIGTSLLLKNIPADLSGHAVDLGSGYGVISRVISEKCNKIEKISAVDISSMAVASTMLNVPNAEVLWEDGLYCFGEDALDAVISNPPFHVGTNFSVNEGLRLFKQVEKVLKSGGRFILVANSGLNYEPYLEKLFKTITVIDKSRSFTVFEAVK